MGQVAKVEAWPTHRPTRAPRGKHSPVVRFPKIMLRLVRGSSSNFPLGRNNYLVGIIYWE